MNRPSFRQMGRILLVIVLLATTGCSVVQPPATPDATMTALSASVARTATAAKADEGKVDTLGTAEAEATEKAQSIVATQTARAAGRSEEVLAQATIAAPIVAELPQYGLDTSSGKVGWVHDPLTLEINGYQQMATGNDHPEVIAADFVWAADVTWDTQYGSSGCGLLFRSDGNQKEPNGYMILGTRFGNGHVIFTAMSEGEIANIHDFYPATNDRSFQWQNKTKNRIAVIARGNIIEVYTNYVKIGEIDTTQPPERLPAPPKPAAPLDQKDKQAMDAYTNQLAEYQDILKQSEQSYQLSLKNYTDRKAIFSEGFMVMLAASESGKTICTYENAWLWLLE